MLRRAIDQCTDRVRTGGAVTAVRTPTNANCGLCVRMRIGLIEWAWQLSCPAGWANVGIAGGAHNARVAFHLPRLAVMMK